MFWNFQRVKCLDKHVEQDDGRKKRGLRGRIPRKDSKEWACLQHGGSFSGFGFECQSVFKSSRPDSENSKLVWAPTGPKVTSRNPRHATAAHWHRYTESTSSELLFHALSIRATPSLPNHFSLSKCIADYRELCLVHVLSSMSCILPGHVNIDKEITAVDKCNT